MDIFAAPSTPPLPLPRVIQARSDHPQVPLGIDRATTKGPLQTNKFYLNLQLGEQDCPAYVVPYTVSWTKGRGPTGGWGLTVSYASAEQRVLGPATGPCGHPTGPASYYYSPPLTQNLVLDAAELDGRTALTVEAPAAMSVQVSLRPGGPQQPAAVQFPLVQGQGFVTALYGAGARPVVRSAAAFQGIDVCDLLGPRGAPGVRRFVLQLSDGTAWLLYARSRPGAASLELYRDEGGNASVLYSRVAFAGSVQVARLTGPQDVAVYDRAAGVYAHGVALSGFVTGDGRAGGYGFAFAKADAGGDAAFAARTPLVHFALPHHWASFAAATRAAVQGGTVLQTPTKGVARAVLADAWALEEGALAADLGFLPWSGRTRRTATVTATATATATAAATATAGGDGRLAAPGQPGSVLTPALHATMVAAARQELAQDMDAQTDLDSMYFAGKGLAKFATVVLAAHALLGTEAVGAAAAADGLRRLRAAFARFAANRQRHPLVYERAWGGVVSSGAYTTGDAMTDFGGSYYNDHHFHYGYFVYAGAVLAHLDPAWLQDAAAGPAFVDMLVRDYASAGADGLFPDSRSFDWFHGHSWAHGLFQSVDGKTQESSSEDTMALYALRLWGLARGDAVLAARAGVQLAVQARALQAYYYCGAGAAGSAPDREATQPAAFAGNKVAGILFENKVDHTTFFGNAPEYIHGIHMLPLLPCSPLARPPAFVADEWADLFGGGRADAVPGGWRGVLYGNLATADPAAALAFFGRPDFDMGLLDGGASRTWYLCYAAGE